MFRDVTSDQIDIEALERDIASCRGSHTALMADLRSSVDADPTTPSALPGWTLGHVLTHMARNGASMLDLLAGRPQYPSVESRNADIEAGAARPWGELVDDVASTAAIVDAAFESQTDWSGVAVTMAGDRPHTQLPLMRQREVEVHRADLAMGYAFGDMPHDYVRRDLRMMEMMFTARKPMGMTSLPDQALEVDPSTRLAWLMGRADIAGLDPAGLF